MRIPVLKAFLGHFIKPKCPQTLEELIFLLLMRLWNYLRGYIIINVSGYFVEKFINLCANKGIYLWDVKRKQHNNITLKMSIRGFKSLRGIVRKTRCKVRIAQKIGIPFIKHRYRRRKTFIAGFLAFFIIIYILSSFVWVIEINGLKNVNSQEIIDYLDQNGIKPGIIKYRFDKHTIIPNMLIKIDELAWAEISLVGTKVIVNVVERVPKPQIVDRSTPCNIYSNNNGVINKIITKNGLALVSEGAAVKKGQMLITGIIENRFNPQDVRYVHSDGIIKATTWYEDFASIDFVFSKKERTGNYKAGYGYKVFSDYHNIFRSNSPYEIFDIDEKAIRLSLWKNYELPIELVVRKYYEAKYNEYTLTEEQAKELAGKQALEKAEKLVPQGAEIIDKKIEYQLIEDNKTLVAKSIIECIEDIGYKEKIVID